MLKHNTLPGSESADDKLFKRYQKKQQLLGENYHARTQHKDNAGNALFTNRLFLESSPYLLQHAHNPVNWFPWGTEAFNLAKELNRPVLLSIGYSTCHWCHVMEEESFEDIEIAQFLNEHFIAIKVDREERPDVDAIYMSAIQAMIGQGGWPLNVWLTPDKKPFFGGTYFPARDGDRGNQRGFLSIIKQLQKVYAEQPEIIDQSSTQLAMHIQKAMAPIPGQHPISDDIIEKTAKLYANRFDSEFGGLEGAPKFPSSYPVRLLLRHYQRTSDKQTLNNIVLTLNKMADGGMHDHIGGGFHRYSVDSHWLVPHFEKMLYDNALLAVDYLEAYQVTQESRFKQVVNSILRYIARDMTSPEGAFYSATDADSPTPDGKREEGWFFTWTPKEIDAALEEQAAKLVKTYFQISEAGNFEGRGIAHTPDPLIETAKECNLSLEAAEELIETSIDKLYIERLRRPAPIRDEKILTAWNALMISAYAKAGLVLNSKEYIEKAEAAANFIVDHLYKDGRLSRRYMNGESGINAYLEDYSFSIAAFLDLYESTHNIKWMSLAIQLDQTLEKQFEDKKYGGFYMTSHDHEELLAREKPAYDGAEPSGNSVALLNLLRLHAFTGQESYLERAEKALDVFSSALESNSVALSEMLLAVDYYQDKIKQIVIVTAKGKPESAQPFIQALRQTFLPNHVLSIVEEGAELSEHAEKIPLLKGKHAINGQATAYVCVQNTCQQPTTEADLFTAQIVE